MALRNPTNEETQEIIRRSLGVPVVFEHEPHDPRFLEEILRWTEILEMPRVTKTFLHTNTLVATMSVIPDSHPTLGQKVFFKHLRETERETVREYRDFLQPRLVLTVEEES